VEMQIYAVSKGKVDLDDVTLYGQVLIILKFFLSWVRRQSRNMQAIATLCPSASTFSTPNQ